MFNIYALKNVDVLLELGGLMETVIDRLTVTINTSSSDVIGCYRVKR
jgi:hypothetical protein